MIRIGHGYDVHRFDEQMNKTFIILGGVKISYERGILAHSDGDVVIHSVCDAILGALALGDIGQHFPDTDQQYKNCDSRVLLKSVIEKIHSLNYQVGNIDVSVVAEKPKLAPYILAMRENLAIDCQVSINDISIKATTNEGLDAIGQKQGIAVYSVALLCKCKSD